MEIIKEENQLKDNVNSIIKVLENNIIERITAEERDVEPNNTDTKKIIKETTKKGNNYFNLILENILNYYLNKIKDLNVKEYFELTQRTYINEEAEKIPKNFRKAERLIDDVMESYEPCEKYKNVYEDAEYVAYSLMRKKVNCNNLSLPELLNLDYVKFYSISSSILPKEIDDEIWYMILYIATHYYVLRKIVSTS